MSNNSGSNDFQKFIFYIFMGGFLILMLYCCGAILGDGDRCKWSGCWREAELGSSYCYYHNKKEQERREAMFPSPTPIPDWCSPTPTRKPTATPTPTPTPTPYNSHSSGSYNHLNNDPDDYDSPEDYEDDAWGDDFDGDDDAGDYWDNY